MIIWKGKGILVPIIFFAIAFIVSFFVTGKTIFGNTTLMSWSCLISGLLLLLIGFASLPEKNNNGVQRTLLSLFNRDTFFFIPIIVWGVLCTSLGIFLFI